MDHEFRDIIIFMTGHFIDVVYSKKKRMYSWTSSAFIQYVLSGFQKKEIWINHEDKVQKYRGKYPFPDAIEIRAASLIATDGFPSTGRARTAVTLFVGPLEQGPFMAQVTGRERLAPQREYANPYEERKREKTRCWHLGRARVSRNSCCPQIRASVS